MPGSFENIIMFGKDLRVIIKKIACTFSYFYKKWSLDEKQSVDNPLLYISMSKQIFHVTHLHSANFSIFPSERPRLAVVKRNWKVQPPGFPDDPLQ